MSHAAHTSPIPPSDWIRRWAHLIEAPGGRARVLDLACGNGRHTRWLVRQGHHVTAVDRDTSALAGLQDLQPWASPLAADLEQGDWPLTGRRFDAVVVTHYLWRPLWPHLLESVRPGGVLLYETFNQEHARVGRPSRPDFLLQHGELLTRCATFHIVAYENGRLDEPMRHVQRIVAIRPDPTAPLPQAPLRPAG